MNQMQLYKIILIFDDKPPDKKL